jgi:hypothetical protein
VMIMSELSEKYFQKGEGVSVYFKSTTYCVGMRVEWLLEFNIIKRACGERKPEVDILNFQ